MTSNARIKKIIINIIGYLCLYGALLALLNMVSVIVITRSLLQPYMEKFNIPGFMFIFSILCAVVNNLIYMLFYCRAGFSIIRRNDQTLANVTILAFFLMLDIIIYALMIEGTITPLAVRSNRLFNFGLGIFLVIFFHSKHIRNEFPPLPNARKFYRSLMGIFIGIIIAWGICWIILCIKHPKLFKMPQKLSIDRPNELWYHKNKYIKRPLLKWYAYIPEDYRFFTIYESSWRSINIASASKDKNYLLFISDAAIEESPQLGTIYKSLYGITSGREVNKRLIYERIALCPLIWRTIMSHTYRVTAGPWSGSMGHILLSVSDKPYYQYSLWNNETNDSMDIVFYYKTNIYNHEELLPIVASFESIPKEHDEYYFSNQGIKAFFTSRFDDALFEFGAAFYRTTGRKGLLNYMLGVTYYHLDPNFAEALLRKAITKEETSLKKGISVDEALVATRKKVSIDISEPKFLLFICYLLTRQTGVFFIPTPEAAKIKIMVYFELESLEKSIKHISMKYGLNYTLSNDKKFIIIDKNRTKSIRTKEEQNKKI